MVQMRSALRVLFMILGLLALILAPMALIPAVSGLWSKTLGISGQVGIATLTPTPMKADPCLYNPDSSTELCKATPTSPPAKEPKPTASVPAPVVTQVPGPFFRYTPRPADIIP